MFVEFEYYHYLNNPENVSYPLRKEGDKYIKRNDKQTREEKTLNNVLNYSLLDIDKFNLVSERDHQSLNSFKDLKYKDRIEILKILLKFQSYAIKKTMENQDDFVIPNLGVLKFSKYRHFASQTFKKFSSTLNLFEIKNKISSHFEASKFDDKYVKRDLKFYKPDPILTIINKDINDKLIEYYDRVNSDK